MDMAGERLISAPQNTVWSALNDPEILKACIPGCESLEATSENEMTAVAAVKLGPISAKFSGRVRLSDIDPPNGYTLSGEGKGGPAGFAKGAAKVRLVAGARRYAADLHGGSAGRRQDRAAGRAADRCHREIDGGSVLHEIHRAGAGACARKARPRPYRASRPERETKPGTMPWLLVGAAVVVVIAAALFLMQ